MMPDFQFTSPEGKKYTVTGPEGATPEQAFQILQGQLGGGGQKAPTAEKPSGLMDFFKSIPRGIVGGATKAASALGQAEAGQQGMEGVPSGDEVMKMLQPHLPYGFGHQPQTAGGRYGAAAGEALGNPSTYMGGPGGFLRGAASGVAGALGAEAGSDLTKGSLAGRLIGGAVGGITPGLVERGVARVATPIVPRSAERTAAANFLKTEGVELPAGMTTGSKTLRATEKLGDRVLGGESYSANTNRALEGFTRSVTKEMGREVPKATPEVMQRVMDRESKVLEDVAKKLPIKFDKKLNDEFSGIAHDATRNAWVPDSVKASVSKQIEEIINGFHEAGDRMSGTTYQGFTRYDTPLGRAIRSADENVSSYAQRIRSALDDALERTARGRGTREGVGMREAYRQLREARQRWYNMLIISKSVAGPGEAAAEGTVLPEKLRSALASKDTNKLGYAQGRNKLAKLARAGIAVGLKAPESVSGLESAAAHGVPGLIGAAAGGMATGGPVGAAVGALGGGAALPGITGRVVNSGPVQTYLKKGVPALKGARKAGAAETAINAARGATNARKKNRLYDE